MKRLFLDTNILIDLLANRPPFAASAAKLFDLADKRKVKLLVSALSYSNIYYIIKKNCTHKELISILRDLEALTESVSVTRDIILKSLASDFKDFEDAIQYYTACSDKNIVGFITRNVKEYKNSAIPVLTADEFIGSYAV